MDRSRKKMLWRAIVVPMLLSLLIAGCEGSDARLTRLAEETSRSQAEQNQEMARLNREVAQSHERLIEADAQSRQELVALQHDLQAEHAVISQQRDALEAERRDLAQDRHRDPIIAAAITSFGLLLACLLPLILAWRLLTQLRHDEPDESLGELLTLELTASSPALLPAPPVAKLSGLLPEDLPDPSGDEQPALPEVGDPASTN